jgi:hypothetical protein
MLVLFFQLFVCGCLGNIFTFDDAVIKVQTVSSGQVITYAGETTPCSYLKAGLNQIYHVSKTGVYQSSLKGQLGSYTNTMNMTDTVKPVVVFDVNSS